MKNELTIEQSRELIELGISEKKASKIKWWMLTDYKGNPITEQYKKTFIWCGVENKPYNPQCSNYENVDYETESIFTLSDLLSIVPLRITKTKLYEKKLYHISYDFTIRIAEKQWLAMYLDWGDNIALSHYFANEPIDALFELVKWCKNERYI